MWRREPTSLEGWEKPSSELEADWGFPGQTGVVWQMPGGWKRYLKEKGWSREVGGQGQRTGMEEAACAAVVLVWCWSRARTAGRKWMMQEQRYWSWKQSKAWLLTQQMFLGIVMGGKKNSAGAGVCSWELRDPASFSLLAVSAKKSKGIHLKGFHMMQLHLSWGLWGRCLADMSCFCILRRLPLRAVSWLLCLRNPAMTFSRWKPLL